MKFLFFFLVLVFFSFTSAFSFDVTLLQNNKEAVSRIVTKKDRATMLAWAAAHHLGPDLKARAVEMFRATMITFEARDAQCDPGLADLLIDNAKIAGVIEKDEELMNVLVLLRDNNQIDDILMGVIIRAEEVRYDLANAGRWKRPKAPRKLLPAPANLDLKKYFGMMTSRPDEVTSCHIGRYFRMSEMLKFKTKKERDQIMYRLAHIGLRDGLIDVETYHRMNALMLDEVLDWDQYSNGYLSMISSAKDKLAKTRETISTNNFSAKYISRKEGLTQRGRLYKTFTPTQVMIMAGVIEKLTRRLDAQRAELIFHYGPSYTVESQTYVLSPMEQYRIAVNMMKKEMAELMRGDLFRGTGLTYEDIIAASYETGMIKSAELDYILKFEEFWNPKTSRFRAYANFALNIAGTASFYLPPPFNIVGAVALMFTQTRLMPAPKPDPDDNWNVIVKRSSK